MTHVFDEILKHNEAFVVNKEYIPYQTDSNPNKKLAILTCMDSRLTELLPAALGIKNGDAKIIKNAGGMITSPVGSTIRSLVVSIYAFDIKQVMIIDDKLHQSYLQIFVEEPLNFEEFVNFELGNLFDEDRKIEQIIPNENASQFVIIYSIKL